MHTTNLQESLHAQSMAQRYMPSPHSLALSNGAPGTENSALALPPHAFQCPTSEARTQNEHLPHTHHARLQAVGSQRVHPMRKCDACLRRPASCAPSSKRTAWA